jgi:hypothetical protein
MPPGAIGDLRRQISSPLSGYFQPVRIRVPDGTRVALVGENSDTQPGDQLVGLQIGPVYRLRVTQILNNPGVELYPTIELIDRLYPPHGLALRYPVPIELTQEELQMAAEGLFVTRIIYLEDPHQALADSQDPEEPQPWTEAPHGSDPLVVADELGRPMAILRIGSRVPRDGDQAFNYRTPPVVRYENEP